MAKYKNFRLIIGIVTALVLTFNAVILPIVGEGKTTITLTVTGEGYKEVSATCEVTVTNSDNVTFDFATDSFDSIPSTSDTNQYYYSEEIEKSSVVVNINGKFRHWSNTDLRFQIGRAHV